MRLDLLSHSQEGYAAQFVLLFAFLLSFLFFLYLVYDEIINI